MKKPILKSSPKIGLQLAAALSLFALSAALVADGKLSATEQMIFHLVYDLPEWLWLFFLAITQLGNIWTLLIAAGILFFMHKKTLVIKLLMSGLLAYLMAGTAKNFFGRPRPDEFILDLVLRDYAWGPGFPSGHVALATAVSLTAAQFLPPGKRRLVIVAIVLVGLSRIYLGVHAPIDVLGGFALGWAAALVIQLAPSKEKRLKRT